jgi:hypothetical protein
MTQRPRSRGAKSCSPISMKCDYLNDLLTIISQVWIVAPPPLLGPGSQVSGAFFCFASLAHGAR